MPYGKWLPSKELREEFGISRSAWDDMRLAGLLPPHILVGARRRFRLDEAESFSRARADASNPAKTGAST
jgi:hypothetical protein